MTFPICSTGGCAGCFLIAVPASVALVILSGPLLTTFFYFGKFTAHDVRMSANALMAFSFGLLGFILIKVLAPGFYARQDTKTPMRIGAMSMGVNIVLSLLLVMPLKHVGLALAISLAAFVNAGVLFFMLRRLNVYRPAPGWTIVSGAHHSGQCRHGRRCSSGAWAISTPGCRLRRWSGQPACQYG